MFAGMVASGFFLGLLVMLVYTPMLYAKGIYKMTYAELSTNETILCAIPFINVVKAEKLYTGKVSKVLLATVFFVLMTALRVWAVYFDPSNYILQTATVILFILSLIVVYFANFYSVFIVLNDAQIGSLFDRILKAVFFPLGQYYIGTYLNTVLDNMQREEQTFR